MLAASQEAEGAGTNHPLALRMAVIAFLTNNITIGTLWGSFSVLLSTVETRLGVGRELSTLGIPVVTLAMTACAPVVGVIAARYSLRLLMLVGAILSTAGFALLAATSSYPLYLLSYGLFLGPGMAIGVILPATLVTRWFIVGRGRALGIACTPFVVALIPLASSWTLHSFGLTATYWMLAALSAVAVIANLFIVDQKQARYIDCNNLTLPFGPQFVADIVNRTHNAQDQTQCLLAAELVIKAQKNAKLVHLES